MGKIVRYKKYKKKDVVFKEGILPTYIFILFEGLARLKFHPS